MEHVQAKCTNPDCGGTCNVCCLFVCDVCGLYEGSLTTECPGEQASSAKATAVYEGEQDFRNGKWVNEVSIHSPKFCGISREYVNKLLSKHGLTPVGAERSTNAFRVLRCVRQAYKDGYTDSLKNYAVNKNGELLTAMGRNVKDLIEDLEKQTVPVKYC